MNLIETIDVKMAGFKAELKLLESIEDPEEQGYRSAPLICQIAECDAKQLFLSVINNPSPDGSVNKLRDHGMVRWCGEQLRKEQGTLNA